MPEVPQKPPSTRAPGDPFRYCHNCGAAIQNPPTIHEDLRDGQFCPTCGLQQPADRSPAQWFVELWDWCCQIKLPGNQPPPGPQQPPPPIKEEPPNA